MARFNLAISFVSNAPQAVQTLADPEVHVSINSKWNFDERKNQWTIEGQKRLILWGVHRHKCNSVPKAKSPLPEEHLLLELAENKHDTDWTPENVYPFVANLISLMLMLIAVVVF